MDILGQSSLLVAITSFALGFAVLARNVRNKLFIAFALMTSVISLWSGAFFFHLLWPDVGFYRAHLFLNIWLAPAALGFIRVLVRIRDWSSRRLLDSTLLGAFCLSLALIVGWDSNPGIRLAVNYFPGVVLLQILQLMWIDRKLRKGLPRAPKLPVVGLDRRTLIYLGGVVVLCISVMDHVPWMGKIVPSIGNLALTVYIFFLSEAISQQRLLNFGAVFSRFLVLTVVSLILTALYLLLVAWIERKPALFFLNSFIFSFFVVTLLEPLRSLVGYLTRRLLGKKHQRLEIILREAQRRLTGTLDISSLFQSVHQTLELTVEPEFTAVFILRSDGTRYRRLRALGGTGEVNEILAGNPLLEHCEALKKRGEIPILLDQMLENEMDRSASRSQRERLAGLIEGLRALGATMLIPLIDTSDSSNRILAFLALQAGHPPEAWGNNWGLLRVIYPYFEQVAQAMRNMEIYVRSREKERLATIGEMAAGLAHEIRNPLGAIRGAAQLLDPHSNRPESRFLGVIIEEVDRLNRVVTQFLDYSKPPTTDFKPVDLTVLAAKTVELTRASLPSHITLEFEKPKEEARVLAAPEQIQQVLINLVQNSIKALEKSPTGRILIRVDIEGMGAFREASVTVEDTGPGIKREHLEKLFIPFFTTSPSGTGLGLSISQKLIEAHRGRIEVFTEEGRFARFSVILPYQPLAAFAESMEKES